MDYTPSTRKILALYRSATPSQVSRGMNWYDEAHALALELDPQNVDRGAGVLAAYSPMTKWEENVSLAHGAYQGVFRGHPMTKQVKRILSGEPVPYVLKGLKTFNFALLIAHPSDPEAVVIDRHAFNLSVGAIVSDDVRTTVLKRKGKYEEFANAYRRAAKRAKITPSQMQAITWLVWRETKIRTAAAMRREVEEAA